MMNREEFQGFIDRLLVHQNSRRLNYSRNHIEVYIYLYLLYLAQKQGKALSPDVLKNWENLEIPGKLRLVLEKFINEVPDLNEENINACSLGMIINVFRFTYGSFLDNYSATRTPEYIYSLLTFLLELTPEDKIADYYGNSAFLHYLRLNGFKNNYCFASSEEDWIFFQLYYEITGNEEYCRNINLDLINKGISEAEQEQFKFSKIYAFPPFYQKLSEGDSSNNVRIVRHMQRGAVDKTEALIWQVLNSLEENGKAVVLVSNSLFTRKYTDFQKEIILQKYLTKIVNLPLGIIYPRNISTSLLVFDKKLDNKGVDFIDLRFCVQESKHAVDNDELMSAASILVNQTSDFSAFVSYEKIADTGYDLNSAAYITGMNYYSLPSESQTFTVANATTSYNSQNNFFLLENEAQIFRGVQDTNGIKSADECQNTMLPLCRYLKISDIEDNRIKDTMEYVRIENPELLKFTLTERDIVITKTAMPIKLALLNSGQLILPAGNFFVIRLKGDSELNRYYLKSFLESSKGLEKLMQLSSGGSLSSLTKGKLEQLQIPYKSQTEQLVIEKEYKRFEEKIINLEKQLEELKDERGSFFMREFKISND